MPAGYSLFYLNTDGSTLMRQELVRIRPCLHRDPARLVLVGATHVSMMRIDESGWTRIDLPEAYAKHEPIRTIAVDSDKRIAVAGSKVRRRYPCFAANLLALVHRDLPFSFQILARYVAKPR